MAGGRLLRGCYSFVEDFRRNRVSATKARRAVFGNGWIRTLDDKWQPLTKARFTADANPVTNIDAGLDDGRFFLATGGETVNGHTKLRSLIKLPEANRLAPQQLPQLRLTEVQAGKE